VAVDDVGHMPVFLIPKLQPGDAIANEALLDNYPRNCLRQN